MGRTDITHSQKRLRIARSTKKLDYQEFMGSGEPGSFLLFFAGLPGILTADFPMSYNTILIIGPNTQFNMAAPLLSAFVPAFAVDQEIEQC